MNGATTTMAWTAVALLALGLNPAPVQAQAPPAPAVSTGATAPEPSADQLQRWNALTEEQKNEMRRRYDAFKKLPQADQDALRARLQRFKALSPPGVGSSGMSQPHRAKLVSTIARRGLALELMLTVDRAAVVAWRRPGETGCGYATLAPGPCVENAWRCARPSRAAARACPTAGP